MRKHLCIDCGIEMKKSSTRYKSLKMELLQCPKCKVQVYTEEQAHKAMLKLERQRLKEEYTKKTIKIGHSWGLTFPKDIISVFDLKSKKLRIHPNLAKNRIEIAVE